ncbi:MAG TPA: NapC/NirT family cytochrome c [Anaeromyxobacteraceae bacterium]|nr:NapC/NirT family cytochrome c [Anaeromyxobacteraceae bacterium]
MVRSRYHRTSAERGCSENKHVEELPPDWSRHPLGLIGAVLAAASGTLVLGIFAIGLAGYEGSPYIGVIAYTVLPALFIAGLLFIPLGLWLEHRRVARLPPGGAAERPLPVFDLNRRSTRRRLVLVAGITVMNLFVIAVAGYKGVQVMDSPQFCGSCHSVMEPESVAHRGSPHARVACVECHIGPGASWFVKSKLSGAWQVVSVAFHLYSRPIPTPVKNLRPARETCEQCHWPEKFVGNRVVLKARYDDDEKNTPKWTALLMRVGGGPAPQNRGTHWHVMSGVRVRYRSDARREQIGSIEATLPDGEVRSYTAKGAPSATGPWREMDCLDCHNRPSHPFRLPEDEVDAAMTAGRLDPTLPFLHREAVKALKSDYASREAALVSIRSALRGFYAASYPPVASARGASIDAAARELGRIYAANIWPRMKIGWNTYPSLLGHTAATGCFRCHDEEHATKQGRTVSQDCSLCHQLLATDEPNPPILKQIAP